jgi:Fic family protein
MMKYIHQLNNWPQFIWDNEKIAGLLGSARNHQGRLIGRMESLGFSLCKEAVLQTLTLDIIKSSEIEGEKLDMMQVRSSIARKLGIDIAGLVDSDRHVDGIVEMMLDATQNFDKMLTKDRLCQWQAAIFPGGYSGMRRIKAGTWRDDKSGPMQVVSGKMGQERIHFEAPSASCLDTEMKRFIDWFNKPEKVDPVLKAAIAHLWFVTIHPFDDGNGRIARAITDMLLARADRSKQRFYSMSVQIRKERDAYYGILEKIQKAPTTGKQNKKGKGIDITNWLYWFLTCLDRALTSAENSLSDVLKKADFWKKYSQESFNERQRIMINKIFVGFEGKLTTSKWAKMTKCSQDTAHRDILGLIDRGILVKDSAGGRSTGYLVKK